MARYHLGMANLAPQDDYIKTALRLPRELHARIQLAAEEAGRSMNAELIHRLETSFFGGGSALEITVHADMDVTMKQLREVLGAISPHMPPDQSISVSVITNKE